MSVDTHRMHNALAAQPVQAAATCSPYPLRGLAAQSHDRAGAVASEYAAPQKAAHLCGYVGGGAPSFMKQLYLCPVRNMIQSYGKSLNVSLTAGRKPFVTTSEMYKIEFRILAESGIGGGAG